MQPACEKKEKNKPETGLRDVYPQYGKEIKRVSKQHQDRQAVGMTKQQTEPGEDTR